MNREGWVHCLWPSKPSPHLKWKLGRWRSAGEVFLSRFSEVSFLLIISVYVSHKCVMFSFAVIYFSVFFFKFLFKNFIHGYNVFWVPPHTHSHSSLLVLLCPLPPYSPNSITTYKVFKPLSPSSAASVWMNAEASRGTWMPYQGRILRKLIPPSSSHSCQLSVPLLGERLCEYPLSRSMDSFK